MSVKILASTEVRDHMSQVLNDVSKNGNSCFITQHGKAQAVILSVDRFEELLSLVEDSLDEKDELLALRITQARRTYKKGKGIPFEV
jgi:prevent-host-death family protein